jgi:hypothetical protein
VRRLGLIALLSVAVVAAATAASSKPLLGIAGNADHFKSLTGQDSVVRQAFLGWGQGQSYVRPMAEMNNPINLYSYERKHDAAHSSAAYKSAFCRIFVLLHGGLAAKVDALLRRFGLRPYGRDLPVNPYPGILRVIWNPLAGIEKGANPASRYYPGDPCVDMVGNDMFSSSIGGGSFEENQALYDAHRNKPYSLPEWGLQGVDDPAFVRKICDFIKSRRRTQMAAYYDSKPGSIYDLGTKPQSKAIYKDCITPLGGPVPG